MDNTFEWTGSTSTMVKYYYAGGQRVAMRKGSSTVYYLLGDHLGSTSITANSNGTLSSETRYHPWGATRYSSGTAPTAYQYTGQRNDAGIGLYFYNARYYDPALGRFIQADTIVPQMNNPQLFNRYSYAGNNPILYNDPDGHCGPLCWTGIVLFLTGVMLSVNASDPLPPELRPSEEQGFLGLALMGLGLGLQQIDLLAAAACGDLNCTNEAEAVTRPVIADSDTVIGRLVNPGEAAITPQTVTELEALNRSVTAEGFTQFSAEGQPGFAQAQTFFNQLLPEVKGKAGDVYNLAATAMKNGTLLTADKRTVFDPLFKAIESGLVTGRGYANELIIEVPGIGEVAVKLLEHKQ